MSPALFQLSTQPFDTVKLRHTLLAPSCGAFVCFEGWVRDHHDGKAVTQLSYHAHPSLALIEGERVMHEALNCFAINGAICVHRLGSLSLSEIAVWVGVSASHRDQAFAAARFIIDKIKERVPIWKQEQYVSGAPLWLHQNPASS